jgi:hypothetical protein
VLKEEWSVFIFQNANTSELNVFFFFPSTSACYWDPEVSVQIFGDSYLYLLCATNKEDYNAFAGITSDSMSDFVNHDFVDHA